MYLSLYCKGSKRLFKVCVRERAGDRTELQYFDPTLMAVSVVSFSFSWCSTGGPAAHSAGWWLSLLHLINKFSGPQLIRGPRAPSAWCGFPYHISSITPSVSNWNSLSWLSYIIVQRPLNRLLDLWTGVWSSSSGNNCHAVHRSLSSGASFYECTMGIFFTSSHFRPRDFLS